MRLRAFFLVILAEMLAFLLLPGGDVSWSGNRVSAAGPTYQPVAPASPQTVNPVALGPGTKVQAPHFRLDVPDATPVAPQGGAVRAEEPAAEPAGGLTVRQSFQGMFDTQGLEPADVQIAVGPANLIEMVNTRFETRAKTGSPPAVLASGSLGAFYPVPGTHDRQADPRVIYDAISGRFFATYFSYQNSAVTPNANLYIAVSTTNSALDPWTIYTFPFTYMPDYPGLGISDDKVAVSFNGFQIGSLAYLGEQTLVCDKADLLAGAAADCGISAISTARFTRRPAHSLSSGNDLWIVERTAASTVALSKLSGTPGAANLVESAPTGISLNFPQSAPPDAQHPGGTVDSGDQRLIDSMWRGGRLWTAGTTACDWSALGDSTPRACLHLIELDTTTLSLVQDFAWGSPYNYFIWPALRTDGGGNLHVGFSNTSSPVNIRAGIATRDAADPLNQLNPTWWGVKSGEVAYNGGRWGDYQSVAIDPTDPMVAWFGLEYTESSAPGALWGTWIWAHKQEPAVTLGPPHTDLIVSGYLCAGIHCSDGTAFSGATVKIMDPAPRLLFDDTSSTAATTSWRIAINDFDPGTTKRFSIEDLNAGTTPFTIRGAAPTDSFYIDPVGNVGLGTNAPISAVDIRRTNPLADIFLGLGVNPTTGPSFNYGYAGATFGRSAGFFNVRPDASAVAPNPSLRFMTNNVQRMIIDNEGFVGLGVANPTSPIHHSSGAVLTAGGVWQGASSRAAKHAIVDLGIEEALEAVRNLQPVTFAYNAEPAERYAGFIAEDVPELVATNDRTTLSAMDVVAVLTKVVQEQDRTIGELERTVAEQQKLLADLAARVADLEKR